MHNLCAVYDRLFMESQPVWAQKMMNGVDAISPTIPFVGKEYEKSKTLIYASAENLSHYQGYLEEETMVINSRGSIVMDKVTINDRHRYYFDREQNEQRFFPQVHCSPMNDGSLTLAAAYICQKLNIGIDYEMPKAFLECVAFANFGKFSIHLENGDQQNKDYASDTSFLRESFNYVKADLLELCPEYIIIPKSIFDQGEVRQLLNQCAPQAKCFPIYQINVGNVNRIINRYYEKKPMYELDSSLQNWYEHLGWSGKSKENYLSVFTYLDDQYKIMLEETV